MVQAGHGQMERCEGCIVPCHGGANPVRRVPITGITGQDGSYLTTLLLSKGYEVHGSVQRASIFNAGRTGHLYIDPLHNESTPFKPRTPYAASKGYAYWMTVGCREGCDVWAYDSILFNYESPPRGETFVTCRITMALAATRAGRQKRLYLDNLDTKRGWRYTPECVEGMWLMLHQDKPVDLVLGTGEAHSVREFLAEAFGYAGMDWEKYVEVDPRYFRPTDVDLLLADASKARERLSWSPRVHFRDLVRIMVDADLESADLSPIGEGKKILERNCGSWHRG